MPIGHHNHHLIFGGQPYGREVTMRLWGSRMQNDNPWLDVIGREISAPFKEEFCDP